MGRGGGVIGGQRNVLNGGQEHTNNSKQIGRNSEKLQNIVTVYLY